MSHYLHSSVFIAIQCVICRYAEALAAERAENSDEDPWGGEYGDSYRSYGRDKDEDGWRPLHAPQLEGTGGELRLMADREYQPGETAVLTLTGSTVPCCGILFAQRVRHACCQLVLGDDVLQVSGNPQVLQRFEMTS